MGLFTIEESDLSNNATDIENGIINGIIYRFI
jgi:hypothetical protein